MGLRWDRPSTNWCGISSMHTIFTYMYIYIYIYCIHNYITIYIYITIYHVSSRGCSLISISLHLHTCVPPSSRVWSEFARSTAWQQALGAVFFFCLVLVVQILKPGGKTMQLNQIWRWNMMKPWKLYGNMFWCGLPDSKFNGCLTEKRSMRTPPYWWEEHQQAGGLSISMLDSQMVFPCLLVATKTGLSVIFFRWLTIKTIWAQTC